MYVVLVILHILVALIMVGVILLQSGKGAEIGAAFGGSSQTVFGSRGASSFLSKMTAVAATIFMITSLTLAIVSKRQNYASTLGLDKPAPGSSAPAASDAPGLPAPTQPMADHPRDPGAPASTPAPPAPAPATP